MEMVSQQRPCQFCRASTNETCPLCAVPVCRQCFQAVEPTPDFPHRKYCQTCLANQVEPAIERQRELIEKAKQVHVWAKSFRGRIPVLRTSAKPVQVDKAKDRDDALMQLAVETIRQGFNGLVKVEITSRKVRVNHYQHMEWAATGVPVEVDLAKLERDSAFFNE